MIEYDLPVMREHLRLGMQYKSRLKNTPDWGKFLRLQGLMYLMIGEYDKCRSCLDRSISFFESLDADGEGRYVISIAGAYNYIAETYRLERNFDKALEYYDKAILFNQHRGSYPGAAIIYTDYGVAAYQSGEKEVARELLSYAEELYQSFREYSQMPIALSYLALFDVEDGQYVSAAARLSKALDVGRKMGSPVVEWHYTLHHLENKALAREASHQRAGTQRPLAAGQAQALHRMPRLPASP